MKLRKVAVALGWFSIGLGLTELFGGRKVSRMLGLREPIVRIFGVREIAAGVGLLTQPRKGPWIWARVAGDALDVGALGYAMSRRNPQRRNAALATVAVAPVVALDVLCGARFGLARA